MSVALTDCPKVAPLSEFICLSILAFTFSQLFPRAARFSRVDRRDDWRHYRAAPTAPQPKQSTHKNTHIFMWLTGTHTGPTRTCTFICAHKLETQNNLGVLICIIIWFTLCTGSIKSNSIVKPEGNTKCYTWLLQHYKFWQHYKYVHLFVVMELYI